MRRDGRLHPAKAGRWLAALTSVALLVVPLQAHAAGGTGNAIATYSGLTAAQQATLRAIAQDTWKFYSVDVDPQTHLPMDNLTFAGGASSPTAYGRYTSAANV